MVAPLAQMFAAVDPQLPALLEAYRNGGRVSWQQLGADARDGQAALNRPWFDTLPTVFGQVGHRQRVLSSTPSQPGSPTG